MAYSNYQLNQRVNNLYSLLQSAGGSQTLDDVLTLGNSAGSNDIDMNGNDITGVNNISLTTINGSAYPPSGITPTLSSVLTNGNSATNTITLNNAGVGNNQIRLLPNVTPNTPEIILTDGTVTNTIDKNGYTTRLSNQNITHYLNFSDSSITGVGAIQKNASLSCNPATGLLTATTFSGSLSGTATNATNVAVTDSNTDATFYPLFVAGTGNRPALTDIATTGMTYNPSSSTLTATNFQGTCSTAVQVDLLADSSTNAEFPVVFASNDGVQDLVVDNVAGNFTFNPFTNTLTCPNITGTCSKVATNTNNTNNVYNCVFLTGIGNLATDGLGAPIYTYNPSIGLLNAGYIQASPIYPSGEGTITVTSLTASTLKIAFNNVAGTVPSIQTFTGATGVYAVAQSISAYEFTGLLENCEWTVLIRNTTGFILSVPSSGLTVTSSGTALQELGNATISVPIAGQFTMKITRISGNRVLTVNNVMFG